MRREQRQTIGTHGTLAQGQPTAISAVIAALHKEMSKDAEEWSVNLAAIFPDQGDVNALQMLADELRTQIRCFVSRLTTIETGETRARQTSDGTIVLEADAEAADYVEGLGEGGAEYASLIRTTSTRRWQRYECAEEDTGPAAIEELAHIWQPDDESGVLRFVRGLARAVWADIVQRRLENQKSNPPAVSAHVVAELTRVLRRGSTVGHEDGALYDFEGQLVCSVAADPDRGLPTVDLATIQAVRKSVGLLSSLPAHRLLRFEVCRTHQQWIAERADFRTIRVPGGWIGLAQMIGCGTSHSTADVLHRIVKCQAHLCFHWPDGSYGNLVSYQLKPSRRNRRSSLVITVGDMLLPGAVHAFDKRTRRGREARRLVPLPPLPPFVGRERDRGPQANLQMLALTEFLLDPRMLATRGCIEIPLRRWKELAEMGGVPQTVLDKLIKAWLQGDAGTPPFLKSLGGDLFTLSDDHETILGFLIAGARRRLRGQKGGRQSRRQRNGAS